MVKFLFVLFVLIPICFNSDLFSIELGILFKFGDDEKGVNIYLVILLIDLTLLSCLA